jgi:hypothetical protein
MTPYEDDDELREDDQPEAPQALPMLRVHGEGYITRKDGEVVPFKIEGEAQWH